MEEMARKYNQRFPQVANQLDLHATLTFVTQRFDTFEFKFTVLKWI